MRLVVYEDGVEIFCVPYKLSLTPQRFKRNFGVVSLQYSGVQKPEQLSLVSSHMVYFV
jgi:hypothetical protein